MNKTVTSIGAKASTPTAGFRAKEFKRLVGLVCADRKTLLLGLFSTVVFACLHTVSISAAFPLFKILLEDEGLQGWVDRTVAGRRLGVVFASATDSPALRLMKVHADGVAGRAGFRTGEIMRDVHGASATRLLHDLAQAPAGQSMVVISGDIRRDVPVPPSRRRLELGKLDSPTRWLRWSASLIPGDTQEDKWHTLTMILLGLVVVVVVANVFRYLGEVLIAKAVLKAMIRLRGRLYERSLLLPLSYFGSRSTSDLVGRFVQDIQEIQRGMMTLFSKFMREPLRAVFILILALVLDWRMTLTLVTAAPIAGLVFWRIGRRVKRSNRKLLHAYGEMIGALTASLQNLRVVKAYTAEARERARLQQVDHRVLRQQLKLAKLQAFVSPAMETVAVLAGSLLTIWLAGRVMDHQMSISQFATLGVTLSLLFDPLRKLSDVYVRVQRSTAGAERIFQVIDSRIESDGFRSRVELGPLKNGIEYVDVSFTYDGADVRALSGVNLSIRRGETVAIVGPNGSGKTTLVSMLLRLFNPDSGVIRYDGIDLRDVRLKSLRSQIGLVSQETVVFAGTPIENITYGSDTVVEERVVEAARRACADEFIRNIPGGYEADLAERGTTLSGGQCQRLAIARAIYRNAPILIFDEATSQVDSESEQVIQAALGELARDRTTLIVAHRLSTIQFADRIVVMDEGRVIDSGARQELFDRCPLFRKLCETQFIGEEKD